MSTSMSLAVLARVSLVPMAGAIVSVAMLSGCPSDTQPLAYQGAEYFRLFDGATFKYEEADTGLEAEDDYVDKTDEPEDDAEEITEHLFERTARRSGFIDDDYTLSLAIDDKRLLSITRLGDCLTRCGELSESIPMLEWPLEEGNDEESEITVAVTVNGNDEGEHTESHRFVVGAELEKELPIGSEKGFEVLWTRTRPDETGADASATVAMFVVPELGFGRMEGFDGLVWELSDAPKFPKEQAEDEDDE